MSILSGAVYNYVLSELGNLSGNYFEIGVFNGTGFAQVATNFPDKKCYALDPFLEDGHTVASSSVATGSSLVVQRENFFENIKNLKNVTLFETTSFAFNESLTQLEAQKINIEMITIDGNHHYDNVKIDFDISLKLLAKNKGVIVVDDTDKYDVHRAFDEFCLQHKSRIVNIIAPAGSVKVINFKPHE